MYNGIHMTKEGLPGQSELPSVLDEIRAQRAAVLAEIAAGTPLQKTKVQSMRGYLEEKKAAKDAEFLAKELRQQPSYKMLRPRRR